MPPLARSVALPCRRRAAITTCERVNVCSLCWQPATGDDGVMDDFVDEDAIRQESDKLVELLAQLAKEHGPVSVELTAQFMEHLQPADLPADEPDTSIIDDRDGA